MKKKEEKKEKKEPKNEDLRECISKFLIYTIVSATFVVGITVLLISIFVKKDNDMSFIGQTLLPLWATWVGTILAFYFGKSNFEAATKSYQDIIKSLTPEEKMASIKVQNVMIPYNKISFLKYEESLTKKIVDIIHDSNFKEYNRFAFINDNKILQYMIHRISFTNFLTEEAIKGKNVTEITFQDFITESKKSNNETCLKESGFISISANLLDAKVKMDSIKDCKDVFVTTTGSETEPILGLITNNTIFDNAKV
ncbi:MAG TPA: hypothetical protein PLM70_09680 [Bacteroidales bacterium]|nr:hypothetical protein [Bacteroidales bacterium]